MIHKFDDYDRERQVWKSCESIDYLIEEPRYRERVKQSLKKDQNWSLIGLLLGIALAVLELGLLIVFLAKRPEVMECSNATYFEQIMSVVLLMLYVFGPVLLLALTILIVSSKTYGRDWKMYRSWYMASDKEEKCDMYEDENGRLQIRN